jgi:hypothetical protein
MYPWLKPINHKLSREQLLLPPPNQEHFIKLAQYGDPDRKVSKKWTEPEPIKYDPQSIPPVPPEKLVREQIDI